MISILAYSFGIVLACLLLFHKFSIQGEFSYKSVLSTKVAKMDYNKNTKTLLKQVIKCHKTLKIKYKQFLQTFNY